MTPPPQPPAKPPLFPPLFTILARAALVAIVLINLYYAFGASGFSYRGARFDFGRQHIRQLYAIDDRRAFEVWGIETEHPSLSVVKIGPVFPLFRLCGACVTKGGLFPHARYRKGSWVYTDMPWIEGPVAYDLETGEVVKLSEADRKKAKADPEAVPFYAEHGLVIDKAHRLDVDAVAEKHARLSTVNEMCVILQSAMFVVVAVLGLVALALLPSGLRKRRAA